MPAGIFYGGGGGGGALSPQAPSYYDPRYGGIPAVPNPASSASAAIGANIGNMSQLYSLYGGINNFMAGQAANQLKLNMPNYEGLIGQRSKLIGEELAGQVPQDVVDLLIQQAAERGIATGSPVSPNSNAAYLRALGLTSLDLTKRGTADLSTAVHDTPTAPLSNPTQMFITPDAIQEAQMAANLYASAPRPGDAAREAMSYGGLKPVGGGLSSGIRIPSFPGQPADYGSSPSYGTYVAGATGPFSDKYSNYDAWYKSLPTYSGVPNTVQYGYQNVNEPSQWGAPQGTWFNPVNDSYMAPTSGMGDYTGMSGMNSLDDFDWEFWNDGSLFDEPESYYDPVLDVSSNPAAYGGGNFDWLNLGP